jgi:hypothetical protein
MSSQKASTLRSKFLASLSDEERARIFALTRELERPLGEWVARHPQLMRAVRVPQLSLTLAVAAPYLEVSALLPAARMSFWLFAVDDLLDEGLLPADKLWPLLERALALLDNREGADTGGEPLLEALRDIRDELARFELFAPLRPHLVQALASLLEGMRRELEWSARSRATPELPLPLSFEEYLEQGGIHTIGVLPVYECMLITMGDASIVSRLPHILSMGREAARCIRLANDLRSYERELAEGKLNALGLLQRELIKALGPDDALKKAREQVGDQIRLGLEGCLKLGSEAPSDSRRPEQYLADLVSFVCDFYAHHDYHHTLERQNG